MQLVSIEASAASRTPIEASDEVVTQVIAATADLYARRGYEPPWIGYLAVENGTCVGMCGFKSPPQDNRVEIAYFTFPGNESRGVATLMASELIRLALDKMPAVTVTAQTLPEENASTSILKKLKFGLVGTVESPEDGLVWEWQLSDSSLVPAVKSLNRD